MATSIILAAPAPPTSHSDGECPPSSQALVPFLPNLAPPIDLEHQDLLDLQDPGVLQVQPALFPVPPAPLVPTVRLVPTVLLVPLVPTVPLVPPVPLVPLVQTVPKAPPVQTALCPVLQDRPPQIF